MNHQGTDVRYLLGTNIIIAAMKGDATVREQLQQVPLSDLVLSPIMLGEVELGVEKSQYRDTNQARLVRVSEGMPVDSLDPEVSRHYGLIRGALERKGTLIGANDYWIAAHALTIGAVLVTNIVGKFSRVSGIALENWLE